MSIPHVEQVLPELLPFAAELAAAYTAGELADWQLLPAFVV